MSAGAPDRPGWLAAADPEAAPRTRVQRTYSYDASALDPALRRELPGLEVIRRMARGEAPISAFWQTVGGEVVDAREGFVALSAEPAPYVMNFSGTGHGGWLATLLDSAMGLAVMSGLPPGRAHTTAELSCRYVRPVTAAAGTLRVEGTLVHLGRRTGTAEGRVLGADGRVFAHGATTCLVFEAD